MILAVKKLERYWWKKKFKIKNIFVRIRITRISWFIPAYCDLQPKSQQLHRPSEHRGGTNKRQNARQAPVAPMRYLSLPAEITLPDKTQRSWSGLPDPQNESHPTSMQPLQVTADHKKEPTNVKQHGLHPSRAHEILFIAGRSHFTEPRLSARTKPMQHSYSHYNAVCSIYLKPASFCAHGLATWQDSCNHSTATCNQRFNNIQQLQRTNTRPKAGPHLSHIRGTFRRRAKPLYPKKKKVSCLGFLPQRSSCNTHVASLQYHLSNPHFSTHMATQHNKTHQDSWSYHLRSTFQQPNRTTYILRTSHCKTQRRNHYTSKRTARSRCTRKVSFIAGRSHFTQKNTRFAAPAHNEAHVTSI